MKRRRVTSYDVAERAGVSRTTVSLVLNRVSDKRISDGTVQRVMSAARDLGYIPDTAARALTSQHTRSIGLLLPCDHLLNQTLCGILEVAHEHNFHLIFDDTPSIDSPAALDGLIISGPPFDESFLRRLQNAGVPEVLLGQHPDDLFPSAACDESAAAQAVVAHLAGVGRTRIACISPSIYPNALANRRMGYQRGLEAIGLAYDPTLVCSGPISPETGYAAMGALLRREDPPDAVFALSDELALGALAALQAAGLRIPQDVALAGFDDIPMAAYASPPLTTVRVPAFDLAREAARLLVRQIQGQELPQRHLLLEAQLVMRASTMQ